MRKLFQSILFAVCSCAVFVACNDDDNTWDDYKDWREANVAFYDEQRFAMGPDGNNIYHSLTPAWNTSANILIQYLNDRSKTVGNLSPMLTSTVDVKYIGRLYDGVPFDSSYRQTASYGDSIFRTQPSSVISGWTIALLDMRVGDSARVIIPYNLGYGASGSGVIPPYSTLVFDMKLVDIPFFEVRP